MGHGDRKYEGKTGGGEGTKWRCWLLVLRQSAPYHVHSEQFSALAACQPWQHELLDEMASWAAFGSCGLADIVDSSSSGSDSWESVPDQCGKGIAAPCSDGASIKRKLACEPRRRLRGKQSLPAQVSRRPSERKGEWFGVDGRQYRRMRAVGLPIWFFNLFPPFYVHAVK